MTYKEYEKAVFDWLIQKNQQDPTFTFSLRRKGSKGAELNYFIGTESSNYFGTTFWIIPITYPGSSSDLFDLFFSFSKSGKLCYRFEINQTRSPEGEQNKAALALVKALKAELKPQFTTYSESADTNKMEWCEIRGQKAEYDEIIDLFQDLEEDINKIIPIIDDHVSKIKAAFPAFTAHRITPEEFASFREKMDSRVEKYSKPNVPTEEKPTEKEEKTTVAQDADTPRFPLNQILFGPPGTGKTYTTINKAIAIVNPAFDLTQNRDAVKAEFDRLMKTGQIVFTTFHQSMSYEDFIEGIKPLKPLPSDTHVRYDISDGIFKQLCNLAKSNIENAKEENRNKLNFEEAFEKLKNEWDENPDLKFPLKTEGKEYTILGFTNSSIQFKKSSGGTRHTLSINTLKNLYYGQGINFKQGVGIYYPAILNKLKTYNSIDSTEVKLNNYVLIIDEINRGNVSQIFGELITLIEEDKRLGKEEALEVTLPYSKEKFGVPANVYLIGTMNTADRSVEALDAALRRRFSFEEMPPKPELISPQRKIWDLWWKYEALNWNQDPYKSEERNLYALLGIKEDFSSKEELWQRMRKEGKKESQISYFDGLITPEIDLELILRTINKRIEKLLDKDHQIGHSYFMSVSSVEDLQAAFQTKIIPLLQEYFFGDYGKIGLVLGEGFFEKPDNKESTGIFSRFFDYTADELAERPIYRLKNCTVLSSEEFIQAIKGLLNGSAIK